MVDHGPAELRRVDPHIGPSVSFLECERRHREPFATVAEHKYPLQELGMDQDGVRFRMRFGVSPTGGGDSGADPILFYVEPTITNDSYRQLRDLRCTVRDATKLLASGSANDRKRARRMLSGIR